jgi:hypothetical protein
MVSRVEVLGLYGYPLLKVDGAQAGMTAEVVLRQQSEICKVHTK